MDKEEFERLKAEEKAHLRKLRELKQTHRDVQRKASSVNALNAMRNKALEDETDALTDGLMRNAALQEARLDLSLENEKAAAAEEADREDLAKAQAEALVQQMKAAMGETASETPAPTKPPASGTPAPPAEGKTIGRTPPPADEPSPTADRGAKTIGRRS